MSEVPELRLRAVNACEENSDGDFVLYWMIAFRRLDWNYALQRAVDHARRLHKPLVILEALRCGYPWASDRLHTFVIQGMRDQARRLVGGRVLYIPYLEPEAGAGAGLLEALAARSCRVVTDEFPCFFLPRMVEAAGNRLGVSLEAVDSNGILPLAATDRVFSRAFDFRRFLQKELPDHFCDAPRPHPLTGASLADAGKLEGGLAEIFDRWPRARREDLEDPAQLAAGLPVDHDVPPASFEGGAEAAQAALVTFLEERLDRYAEHRNDVADGAASGLSPYLHFGHLSAHQVFRRVLERDDWSPERVSDTRRGQREGWWGASRSTESFLDELITWREVGYNRTWLTDDYADYDSLPEWAKTTLAEHAGDPRKDLYTLAQFEHAATHDEIWNAAQRQLVTEGRMHNYLRMLWGKKILEWTESPRQALEVMIELNNKYAVDGRNPNSYSGIFWVLGRYDRAWGPEREIFGKIRYMSSDSTRRKLDMKTFLARYGEQRSWV